MDSGPGEKEVNQSDLEQRKDVSLKVIDLLGKELNLDRKKALDTLGVTVLYLLHTGDPMPERPIVTFDLINWINNLMNCHYEMGIRGDQ